MVLVTFIAGKHLKLLRKGVKASQRAAYAEGTNKNLRWQWQSFIIFCLFFHFTPLPATIECLCLYAQFLSRKFKAVESIRNYLSGVRTLHILAEKRYRGEHSMALRLTLRGLARKNLHCVRQAATLSPGILAGIYQTLDLTNLHDITMWALLLLAFFLPYQGSQI